MSKITKAQRNEERRQAAMIRMRLHTLVAILIPTMDGWIIGLNGGGRKGNMEYRAVELPEKERRYFRMQSAKINKARDAVVRLLGLKSFDIGQNFYITADAKLTKISESILRNIPEGSNHTDEMRVLLYIIYAALHDLRILSDDKRPEVGKLCAAVGALANHLLPNESHLLLPMNKVYYETRDLIQENPEWYDVDWENDPTSAEKYLREKEAAA